MKTITYTITYTNNQGLELKINKFTSGQFKWAFSLTFNNGVHTFCYTMTGLRTILLKNGMIRKWAANHYEKNRKKSNGLHCRSIRQVLPIQQNRRRTGIR